jgi:transketolase
LECDGHDVTAFLQACSAAASHRGQPTIVIASTVKGKGVTFMEYDFTWHSRPLSAEDVSRAMEQIP